MASPTPANEDVPPASTVLVCGDVTIDWNIARAPVTAVPGAEAAGRATRHGGAALLADLIERVVPTPPDRRIRVSAPDDPGVSPSPGDEAHHHSYALWEPHPGAGRPHGPGWQVAQALGTDRAARDEGARTEWRRLAGELPTAEVVVLDDAALGFRDGSELDLWRDGARRARWIVLKQARPIADGPLWEHLIASAPDRLVVVIAIDDLRDREVQVSRALSWERSAQELRWELVNKPDVNVLSQVAHTVISFGPSGAMLLSRGDDAARPSCTLFYDPTLAEGGWELEHAGGAIGTTACLTAAIVRSIVARPEAPDLADGIESGVAGSRRLHLDGYVATGSGRMSLAFPLDAVAGEITADAQPLVAVPVPDPAADRTWTILEQRFPGHLSAVAADVVRRGPAAALAGVPLGRFSRLTTADRGEIEAFRSIAALIAEYVRSAASTPLSIGVFGPPGAGKSFGVKQVAKAVAGGLVSPALAFDLAQLRSPDELADAFHLVRDTALSGVVPLVFWDEFDSDLDGRPLGWLKHFLAPMQDGEFREGQLTHRIGRAVFVFAGGTSARVEDFGHGLGDEAFRQAKGPDFLSRLRGYVDVLGPNPGDSDDRHAVIRRAILLRSILDRSAPHLFDDGVLRIDAGVLRAFLEVSSYRHGARSMEAIVASSGLAGARIFARSDLPSAAQLVLHVDPHEFEALVQHPALEGALLERLARSAHAVYSAALPPGRAALPYDDLPDYVQEENRANVRDIPAKLARLGCVMVPASAGAAPTRLTEDEVERLAADEHLRWMQDLGPGWRYGSPTDPVDRVHEAYLPWEDLPPQQQDKDRNLIRRIPAILETAGYTIARTEPVRTTP
ncbi:MAG TPA: hypothetical protein VF156_08385 [Agromyces sp.]